MKRRIIAPPSRPRGRRDRRLPCSASPEGAQRDADDAVKAGDRPVAPGDGVLKGLGEQPSFAGALRGHVVVLNFWPRGATRASARRRRSSAQKVLASHGGTVLGATYQDVRATRRPSCASTT
jgi:hypothetical protein